MEISYIIITIIITTSLLAFSITSFVENEKRAGIRGIGIALILGLIFLMIYYVPKINQELMLATLIVTGVFISALLLPLKKKQINKDFSSDTKYDERDTMFSRKEIQRNTEQKRQYYTMKPDHMELDRKWSQHPGLLSYDSKFYKSMPFAACEASFIAVSQLRDVVTGPIESKQDSSSPKERSTFILEWAKKLGAVDVGICQLNPDHIYSHRGRGRLYGKPVENNHKYAIAFTVEMNKRYLASGPYAATVMESAQQYLNSGAIAVQLSQFLLQLGFDAKAHIDGNYEVIAPLVARDAGLGDIGRMGLLMTPQLGPRVRIAVVTTNAELVLTKAASCSNIQYFCKICKKCAINCPGQAISTDDVQFVGNKERWKISQEKCFNYWCISGTDCGRCMSVCPFSQENNFMHNIIRRGIGYSWIFCHFALLLDKIFYSEKPKPLQNPSWMETVSDE